RLLPDLLVHPRRESQVLLLLTMRAPTPATAAHRPTRRAPTTHGAAPPDARRRAALLVTLTFALASLSGCDTSSSCGPGLVRGPGGECVPDTPPDGGMDAGDAGDATVVDAGPCGACGGSTPLCRESDRQCVQCLGDDDCPA